MEVIEMTDITANNIYDILQEECGATDYWRENFVYSYTDKKHPPPTEYRFQGDLGFGGKFRIDLGGVWYVDCYLEDQNPDRLAKILSANRRLAELQGLAA